MPWSISKKFKFEAAHSLPQLPAEHKCHHLHGHSYIIEVVITSCELDYRGFACIDYSEFSIFEDYLTMYFDHRNLNDVVGGENTTAERLAQHFYKWCKKTWVNMKCVRVYETATTYIEYSE